MDRPSGARLRDIARACDACRRMKIRCIGKEDPPCHRCREVGDGCTFLMKNNVKPSESERVRSLEKQLHDVQASLAAIHAVKSHDLDLLAPSQSYACRTLRENPNDILITRPDHNNIELADRGEDDLEPDDAEGEEDPLRDGAIRAPLKDMLTAVASSSKWGNAAPPSSRSTCGNAASAEMRGTKRNRTDSITATGTGRRPRTVPVWSKGSQPTQHLDPISCGIVSESEAERLFDLFFSKCHMYMPVFDASRDTLPRIRRRSAFCLTAILAVAKAAEDPGGIVSDLQIRVREHAEGIAKDTLFTDATGLDIVQGLILLASWGSLGWRSGNHALAIAYDMGLHECLPHLISTRMGSDSNPELLEEDRCWIEGARAWLTLYKMKTEMALNNGSPVQLDHGNSLSRVRQFLSHPLSTQYDGRLVAACELLETRLILHEVRGFTPNGVSGDSTLDEKMRIVNHRVDAWQVFWSDHYDRQRMQNHAIKALMTIQVDFTLLHVNGRYLHGLKTSRDVLDVSDDRLLCLHRALRASRHLVQDVVRADQVDLRYANGYTHVAIAYAARCYLRLSSLLPRTSDLKQVGRDVENLATTMASYPGLQVSEHLRDAVSKARRSRVLPPSTEPNSPTLQSFAALGEPPGNQPFSEFEFAFDGQDASVAALAGDFEWNQGWDFSLVDQLFSTVTGMGADVGNAGPAFWDR